MTKATKQKLPKRTPVVICGPECCGYTGRLVSHDPGGKMARIRLDDPPWPVGDKITASGHWRYENFEVICQQKDVKPDAAAGA